MADCSIHRLHPRLTLTRIITGRLATSGYPVLGLPKHSPEGRRIRGLVRAWPGWQILAIDYSQMDLRVAAHLSEDKTLVEAFRAGEDIHSRTAHEVLGAPARKEDQDESRHRLPAKAANFGYWMGLSVKGLTETVHKAGALGWSTRDGRLCAGCRSHKAAHETWCDSEQFFAEYNRRFPGARQYQLNRMAHAEQTGYGNGLYGEQWFLPGVWSPHEEVREAAKRQAFALPVQGGTARIIKQAMAQLLRKDLPWAARQGIMVEPILQIHDELLFHLPTACVRPWYRRVKHTMETVTQLRVPIVAEGKAGPSWLEQEKL